MNLLMVAPEYPPHNLGGGGIVVRELARAFKDEGHSVTVAAGYYPSRSPFERGWRSAEDGVDIVWVPLVPTPGFAPHLKTVLPPGIPGLATLWTLVSSQQVDVVHLHGYGHFMVDLAGLFCMIHRKAYVFTVHGIPKMPAQQGKPFLRRAFALYSRAIGTRLLRRASMITAVSGAVASETSRLCRRATVKVVPNGVSLNEYSGTNVTPAQAGSWASHARVTPDDVVLLSIGRISWNKGYEYLVRSAAKLRGTAKNVKVIIIGPVVDSSYYGQLNALVSELGLGSAVTFAGYGDLETRLSALTRADIFVAPSVHEAFSLVVLEAMAMGRPVVASATEGLAELIDDGKTGLLVKPADTGALTSAISHLISRPELRRALGESARARAQDYDWSSIALTYFREAFSRGK